MVVGLTPIGRATVRLLPMNAEDRLKVRAVLKERGELAICLGSRYVGTRASSHQPPTYASQKVMSMTW
jgi:hypothetical protein